MSSEIKVSSVKAKDGTAGISIADSSGNITINNEVIGGFPFTSGYQNIGDYRFLFGSGTSPTSDTYSFTSGGAGTVYYSSGGLQVSLTGFASVLGVVATIESNYVDVWITTEDVGTSSLKIRPCSPRDNDAWNDKTISYLIWGTPS